MMTCPLPKQFTESALAILQQGLELLEEVPQAEYARPLPVAFGASIGGHFRHCLEHFEALLLDEGATLIDYDARKRDRQVETSVSAARKRTEFLIDSIRQMELRDRGMIEVRCKISYGEGSSDVASTSLEREFMYAVVHAVHHFALIRFMANLLGLKLPEHFGKAPSTCQHERRASEMATRTNV